MPSSLHRLPVVLLAMAGLAAPLLGQVRPSLDQDVLVLSPSELRMRAHAVRVLAGPASSPASDEGERVSYTAFNGTTYELTRFHGRHVDVLLPDAWTEPGALSLEQIHNFVDRTDWIYQHFLDLVGEPPAGEGPLPVAIVPDACGGAGGCAALGAKGVEVGDVPELRPLVWQQIAEDIPSGVVVHELTHNFDQFSQYVAYGMDPPHAWTSFITYYYSAYAREGLGIPYEEEVKRWELISGRYFQDPGADWERCVRDGLCEDRGIAQDLAWGGFGFRFGLLDGPQAVRGFLAFLREYRRSHEPGGTVEERNDLHLEAMSAGAGRNLSCVADAWRWPVSDSLRERLSALYGDDNPDCADRDGDGFNALQGDCDDRRAAVHPGAAERLRRVDDDCDGRVDERVWSEPAGRDFAPPPALAFPAEVAGATGGFDLDTFFFRLRAPTRVWLDACFSGNGALNLFDRTGAQRESLFLYAGTCSWQVYSLEAGTWRADISLVEETGGPGYSIAIQNGPPWPPVPWARTAPPRKHGSQFILTAASTLASPPGPGAEVRFWVSGQGIVGTVPYRRAAAFNWTPPPGVDPAAEGLTYRAQLLVQGVPAAGITRPQGFVPR